MEQHQDVQRRNRFANLYLVKTEVLVETAGTCISAFVQKDTVERIAAKVSILLHDEFRKDLNETF